ncbi:MAG: hypothetical protein J2P21_09880 [Chloracidobacterium sp.]|nr:hypothetical protein [Chloracidobacterium sp.]
MACKAILRVFLLLALIVTANMIKPFSMKNVTEHLLYSARSFRFALPAQLRDKFDHANYLAITLSNSLFEADGGIRDFTRVITTDMAFSPMNVQRMGDDGKSPTKQKSSPNNSAPAKQVRIGKRIPEEPPILSSLIALTHTNEIRLVEFAHARMMEGTVSPLVPPCLTKLIPSRLTAASPIRSIEIALTPRKRDCEKRETDQKSRIAWIEDETGAKSAIWVVENSGERNTSLSAPESEEQKTEATAGETETQNMGADPATPRMAEAPRTRPFSSPFAKCAKDQQ